MTSRSTDRLLHRPSPTVILLLLANALAFALSTHGQVAAPADDLVAAGALTTATWQAGDYWRLITCGFLHANLLDLTSSLLSLLVCGPLLERRLGPTAFLAVYLAALTGASAVSLLTHSEDLVVGAGGAVYGVLGALVALWLLGKIHVRAMVFFINFSLQGALGSLDPPIDYPAHLGGFVFGIVTVAMLDLLARASPLLLRCIFPEFVKANAFAIVAATGALIWIAATRRGTPPDAVDLAAWTVASGGLVLLLDTVMTKRRGIAGAISVLAACNGLVAYVGTMFLRPSVDIVGHPALRSLLGLPDAMTTAQSTLALSPEVALLFAATISLSLYAEAFTRGLRDVGFAGAMLLANYRRHTGL